MSGEEGPIGVGIGGACPSCSAPVDLGQQYCLECGEPLRSRTPRRKAATDQPQQNSASLNPVLVAPAGRGFPWVPFSIVLILVATGLVFALIDGDPSASKSKTGKGSETAKSDPNTDDQENFPTVDTQTCEPAESSSGDIDPAADPTADASAGAADATAVPTQPGAAGSALAEGVTVPTGVDPSIVTDPTAAGAATEASANATDTQVYTDQDGNLCTPTTEDTTATTTSTSALDPSTSPTIGSSTAPSGTTSGGSGASNDPKATTWPAGKSGYTVVLASFPKSGYDQSDAEVRATQAQRTGISAGVLDSDKFSSLTGGLWVVFSGVFSTESAANTHEKEVTSKGYQPYVRQITPG